MVDVPGLPPGRSGLLWLRHRLMTAQRGAELLDRKVRVLRGEEERLRGMRVQTGDRWARACAEAEVWLVRAALLGGQRAIRPADGIFPAAVTIDWQAVMGVRYPSRTRTAAVDTPPDLGTSALHEAASAYARALDAAVAHAAATGALLAVRAEIERAGRRARAITQGWIPRLTVALKDLTERLEEVERDEAARLRRGSLSPPTRAEPGPRAAGRDANPGSEPPLGSSGPTPGPGCGPLMSG